MDVISLYSPSLRLLISFLVLSAVFISSAALDKRDAEANSNIKHSLNKRIPDCSVRFGHPDAQSCLDALFALPNSGHITHFGLDATFMGWNIGLNYHVPLPYWRESGNCGIALYLNLYSAQPWEDHTSWFLIRGAASNIIGTCVPQIGNRLGGIDYTGRSGKIIVWVYEVGVIDHMGQLTAPNACPRGPSTGADQECPIVGALPEGMISVADHPASTTGDPAQRVVPWGMYAYCSGVHGCSARYNCIPDGGIRGKGFALGNGGLLFGAILHSVSGCQIS